MSRLVLCLILIAAVRVAKPVSSMKHSKLVFKVVDRKDLKLEEAQAVSIWSKEWRGFGFDTKLIESSIKFMKDENKPQINLDTVQQETKPGREEHKDPQTPPENPKTDLNLESNSTPQQPQPPAAPAAPAVTKEKKQKKVSREKPEIQQEEESDRSEADAASSFDMPINQSEESVRREIAKNKEINRQKQEEAIRKAMQRPINPPVRKFTVQDMPLALDKHKFFEIVPNEKFLVMFFSPKCHHCHEFMPTFVKLSKELFNEAYFATVDCSENFKLCSDAGVAYFPSLYLYYENKYVELTGGRSEENIRNVVNDDEFFLDQKSHQAFLFDKGSNRWYWSDDVIFISSIDCGMFRALAAIALLVLAVVYFKRRTATCGSGKQEYASLCETVEQETEIAESIRVQGALSTAR